MKNEEGTRENFSGVTSSGPSDLLESKSDGCDGIDDEDVSNSRYSSCGESEFERYCSANSVMGTPSLCSSVNYTDCLESDFGSFRSFTLGDETSSLEGFSLGGGRFERKNFEERKLGSSFAGDSSIGFCNSLRWVYGDNELNLGSSEEFRTPDDELRLVAVHGDSERVAGEEGCGGGAMRFSGYNELVPRFSSSESTVRLRGNDEVIHGEDVTGNRVLFPHFATEDNGGELDSHYDCHREVTELERVSRYGDSECDDSMYGGGSDDESGKGIPCQANAYHGEKEGDGNPLVMGSSVAFGVDDWDNFLQETGDNAADTLFLDELHDYKKVGVDCKRQIIDSPNENPTDSRDVEQLMQELAKECPEVSKRVQCANEKSENLNSQSATSGSHESRESRQLKTRDVGDTNYKDPYADIIYESSSSPVMDPCQKDVSNYPATSNQVQDAVANKKCSETFSLSSDLGIDLDPMIEKVHKELDRGPGDVKLDREIKHFCGSIANIIDGGQFVASRQAEDSDAKLVPPSKLLLDDTQKQILSRKTMPGFSKDNGLGLPASVHETDSRGLRNSPLCADVFNECPSGSKTETIELNEFLDDVVHEMEEILLDSRESLGPRFPLDKRYSQSHLTLPSRDGGLTASTSGTHDTDAYLYNTPRIEAVEVFGAKQKKGDVSLSERLVGVKEYTVYRIRVWSGNDQWEVERRYRDFLSLHRMLKSLFADRGWILPSQWSLVDKESRKFFGSASPDVVAERSVLIQECLHSILHSSYFSSTPKPLVWFLYPQGTLESNSPGQQSTFVATGTGVGNISSVGKTISLIIEIHPRKSMKQMLEAQYYRCAGCCKDFNEGRTLAILDFAQTFGWGKPRTCEYTGQLFCSSCHTNESAVLPARILHFWDFTEYPVCQLAKSYLDSIHDKPMLCVSAVNPLLFTKIPALRHVMNVRKKIGSMLSCIHCPFRRSILRGLGSRRYLIESIDFFAPRDLVDLSKGAFSALPVMVETLSRKIREHIMEQCLQCCDVGVPCGARQACGDPSSLIFPFQEDEINRCKTCKQVYHKKCFKKLGKCSCQAEYGKDECVNMLNMAKGSSSGEMSAILDLPGRSSTFSSRVFSGLFSKAKSERSKADQESGNVIVMGSLPNTPI